jgi:diguanylate cyclase (GGDEF)-like protein
MRRLFGQLRSVINRQLSSRVRRDLLVLTGFIAAGYILATQLDVFAQLQSLVVEHQNLPLGAVFGTVFVACVGLTLYGLTRSHATVKELSLRVKAEERARRLALHDQLTGLPNRRQLKGVINFQMAESDASQTLSLILINLDKFKAFNDHYGRAVANELLVSVAKLLNLRAGVDGFVSRLEADQFAVVLLDRTDEELMDWLSSTLTAIEMPHVLTEDEVSISATAGVAVGPADGRDAETLLRRAELAQRRAKDSSRGWFAFFKTGMDQRVHDRAVFEHDVYVAIRDDVVEPFYQPLVELGAGKVCGYEILARWQHEERGMVMPGQFIPVAEATGLISDLTLNLLRKACLDALNWPGSPQLSLNISPILLQDDTLAKRLLAVMDEVGFAPQRLEIQVTEAALVADLNPARAIFYQLKEQGVCVALDNFGTGHSSLRQLRDLPFDKIMIDRSYIETMGEDSDSAALVRAVIAMAKNLGLSSVAEGVETAEQAKLLARLGCDIGQGFLFGKPQPAAELHTLGLHAGSPASAPRPSAPAAPPAKRVAAQQPHADAPLQVPGEKKVAWAGGKETASAD